jgi:hypothetical protein
MNNMVALKIETAGIQKYIFGSNKLKVNLGASYIIEHLLYKELLPEAVEEVFTIDESKQIDHWYSAKDINSVPQGDAKFKIGYIGGGNAILFLADENKAEALNKAFKEKVLQHFPGLEVYSGIVPDVDPDSNGNLYKEIGKGLSDEVQRNRSEKPFVNRTFNHGFYTDCAISCDVASHYWKNEDKWISDEVFAKVQNAEGKWQENLANNEHRLALIGNYDTSENDQTDIYVFPTEFEDLSAENEKAYIAVVHIDGNNLGTEFIKSENLPKTQDLSLKVRELGTEALRATIKEGLLHKDKIQPSDDKKEWKIGSTKLKFKKDEKEGYDTLKLHLPIRPIITGGDDITFVCEGTLGIPLAILFLEKFHEIGTEKGLLEGNVHACAGVAIVKQKYPFYRAYQLSEQLIKEAKKASRGNHGSYLSFMVAGYGTGTSLDDLKNKYANKELFAQTYCVLDGKTDGERIKKFEDFEKLLELFSDESKGQKTIPRNKLMQVREAIVTDQLDTVWPVVNSRLRLKEDDWNPLKDKAISFEAIEILDFYNDAFIKENDRSKKNREARYEQL